MLIESFFGMSIHRYRLRDTAGQAEALRAPASVEVTLTNDTLRTELDQVMLRLGYEFVESETTQSGASLPATPHFPVPGQTQSALPLDDASRELIERLSGNVGGRTKEQGGERGSERAPIAAESVPLAPPPRAGTREPLSDDEPVEVEPEVDDDRVTPQVPPTAARPQPAAPSPPTGASATRDVKGADAPMPEPAKVPPPSSPAVLPPASQRVGAPTWGYRGARALARGRRLEGYSGLPILLVVTLLLLVFVVHRPALSSDFKGQDFIHLYEGVELAFQQYVAKPFEGRVLPFERTAYAALYRLFGLHADRTFLFVFFVHALNVALLHVALRKLTGSSPVAFVVAASWALCPFHQGTVGWFSAAGELFAGLCLITPLAAILRRAADGQAPGLGASFVHNLLLSAFALSLGAGAVAGVGLPVVFAMLVPPGVSRKRVALTFLPAAIVSVFVYYWSVVQSPDVAPAGQMLAAFSRLFAYGASGLLAAPFLLLADQTATADAGTVSDAAYFVGGVVLAILALGAWFADRAGRLQLLGATLLSVLGYAAVTFGISGSKMEQATIEVIVGRFHLHYVAMIGLVLALAVAVTRLIDRVPAMPSWVRIAAPAVVVASFALPSAIAVREGENTAARKAQKEIDRTLDGYERAFAKTPGRQDVYIENRPFEPVEPLFRRGLDRARFPGGAALFAISYPSNTVDGHPVHFIEQDVELVERIRSGPSRRMGELLVTPDEARRTGARVSTKLARPRPTASGKAGLQDLVKRFRAEKDPKKRAELRRQLSALRRAEYRNRLRRRQGQARAGSAASAPRPAVSRPFPNQPVLPRPPSADEQNR